MRTALLRLAQAIPFVLALQLPHLVEMREGETAWTMIAPTVVAGFVALLTASIVTRRKPRVVHRKLWAWASLGLVVATVAASVSFSVALNDLTFVYEPEGRSARFVRGTEYTEFAARKRSQDPKLDDATLVDGVGGVGARSIVWSERSIARARIWLAVGHALLMVSLGGAIFAGLELSGMEGGSTPFPAAASKSVVEQRRARTFDVFLCHNSLDKPAVKEIAVALVRRGVLPWLDEWELRPGTPWTPAIEAELRAVRAAAVFIGPSGNGPWQRMEMNALLSQYVERSVPVIPVLLEGLEEEMPKLPLFLAGMTWVDMRKRDPDPIERLLFGIRGTKEPSAGEPLPAKIAQ